MIYISFRIISLIPLRMNFLKTIFCHPVGYVAKMSSQCFSRAMIRLYGQTSVSACVNNTDLQFKSLEGNLAKSTPEKYK